VRNCRLGMLAILGFWVQAWVTGKGPIQNAVDHLRDPFGQNGESLPSLNQQLYTALCVAKNWPLEALKATTAVMHYNGH
jgi:hypothetical protein